jgi:hypothetical protein
MPAGGAAVFGLSKFSPDKPKVIHLLCELCASNERSEWAVKIEMED